MVDHEGQVGEHSLREWPFLGDQGLALLPEEAEVLAAKAAPARFLKGLLQYFAKAVDIEGRVPPVLVFVEVVLKAHGLVLLKVRIVALGSQNYLSSKVHLLVSDLNL